jgi:hypothetical protein
MKAIIDADSMSYLLGWGFKDLEQSIENYGKVIQATDQFVNDILTATNSSSYMGFLGGVHPTFRHMMNSGYKAKRGLTKPDWYNRWAGVVNHRLKNYWKFNYIEGIEAEDAVSMIAKHYNYIDVVVAHIDKDLMQIPGLHYNYDKQVASHISEVEAAKNLFKQVITGDPTDDVPGLVGVGKVGAEKALSAGVNPMDFLMLALNAFIVKHGEREGIIKFTESYAMVKLLDLPTAGFKPEEYQFINVPGEITNQQPLFPHEIPTTTTDNSKYFVQPDNGN